MWDFTVKDKQHVEKIYQHFLSLLPNMDAKILYNRILTGYCYGEDGLWLKQLKIGKKYY